MTWHNPTPTHEQNHRHDFAKRLDWTQAVHRIRRAQATLRESWTSGAVPVEEEIAMRAKFAELLSNAFEVLGDMADLTDCIEHLETIVRRLGPPSPARAEYLDKLAYMKMSAFKTTSSVRDLEESIRYDQQAKDEVDPADRALLCRIYHNLGYNLSHRAQLGPARPSDIDEAITCGQMVLKLAATDSEEYAATLMNLVSRFQVRFERDNREEDRQSALELIQLRLKLDTPETLSYAYTRLAQGRLAHLGSDDIDGIDDGIARAKDVLRLMPLKHEGRIDVLKEILVKYERRYKKLNERSDLIAAVEYSDFILEAVPPGYPSRLDWAVQHLALIAELAVSSQSIDELDTIIEQACRLREEIPTSHAKRHPSGLAVGAIIAQKYLLSKHLDSFHMLVSHAIRTLHPRLAELDREIQGVQFHLRKLPSEELMLGVEYGLKTVGGIRLLTPVSQDALRQSYPEDMGKQLANTAKLRQWLNSCDYNHGRICNGVLSDSRFSQDINLILVDVRDRCLVRATSADKYFALSYVWGEVQMPSSRRSTLEVRLQPQSLNEKGLDLPTTVVDAMLLVESLGERYLWVDGLCIIEDEEGDKTNNVNTMDIIYGKSFATIMAIHGTDANAGLPGVRPNSRAPQHTESIVVSSRYRDHLGYEAGPPGDTTENITVVATPAPLKLALEASTWKSRGWILQEALLSRRRLYFTKDWVYFQCNKETQCEAPLAESEQAEFLNRPVPLASSTRSKNPLMELKEITPSTAETDLRRIFGIYKELVEILFDLALFWCPAEPLFRRPSSEASYRTNLETVASLIEMSRKHGIKYRLTPAQNEPPSLFPSWSWAGWVGPIEYRLTNLENEPLPTPSVDTFSIYH
ncbi:HET domain-containing protein [Aspergillus candidus]|uniref:Heterokaryon incompatibility protein-domain-containing protein n=1 Tax=Aspergillus candidus TaxID=41067 RepID=A0A2I2F8C9_ASPCN|nr:heterokaryon incompatibility protein-domain-containing protein [Aspergillus candidus]PLB36871.1 heterokaryon incompatibility protein-domain-containing protein [Aspergillus candidus]